jgi:hypothetical protein
VSAVGLPLEAPRTTRVTGSDGVEVAVHRWGVPGDHPGAAGSAQFAAGLVDFRGAA